MQHGSVYLRNITKISPPNAVKKCLSVVKTSKETCAKSGLLLLCSPWKLCTGVSLGLGVKYFISNGSVYCKALPSNRIVQRRVQNDNAKFDWHKFFSYLGPHKLLLFAAVAVSMT